MASPDQKEEQSTGKPVNRLINFSALTTETPQTATKQRSLRRSRRESQISPSLREEFGTAAVEQPASVQESARVVDRWPDLGDPEGGLTTIEKRASRLLSTYHPFSAMSRYENTNAPRKPSIFNYYGASPEGSEVGEASAPKVREQHL